MQKTEIKEQLLQSHRAFIEIVKVIDEESFYRAPEGKWNAGQQLSHLVKSLKAIYTGLVIPKFQLKMLFGKANRTSRSYNELVEKYQSKLDKGYENRKAYMPAEVEFKDRKALCDKLMSFANRLGKQLEGFDEEQLDTYLLPHPLLGKLTIREMAYFAIYHVQHHQKLTKKYAQRSGN